MPCLLRAIYGTFHNTLSGDPKKCGDLELAWVEYIAGKRESRRLIGDHILTERDVVWTRPNERAAGKVTEQTHQFARAPGDTLACGQPERFDSQHFTPVTHRPLMS